MSEPFIGQIMMFGGNFAPRGWALCDGQLLSIASNSALFSILGTMYGGDGRSTFGLPDLRSRVPMHAGNGPGLTPKSLGQKSGTENVTMTTNQMPPHNHGVTAVAQANSTGGNANTAVGNVWSNDAGYYSATYSSDTDSLAPMANQAINVTENTMGGGQSQTNLPPYQVVNFIIALVGVFPSRN
ncbi:phage tail protein [Thalassotalea sp. M1531]|uniref:Phage tail protein n=1 Tax=Thalassotalea algicola TaxID=2716224 RepID=A0A7Y0Q9U3_9GAMM|nr:tail fiber protein [Thalassotalea algicola]NMP33560.1 phage tail protein [Thalassotalea algicola]